VNLSAAAFSMLSFYKNVSCQTGPWHTNDTHACCDLFERLVDFFGRVKCSSLVAIQDFCCFSQGFVQRANFFSMFVQLLLKLVDLLCQPVPVGLELLQISGFGGNCLLQRL
jgi:hypothetical protein